MARTQMPSQVAEKWKRNFTASTEAFKQGVQAVTISPTELAARQGELALENYRKAIESGLWARRLRAVSLEEWRQSMLTTGVNRMSSGAVAGQPKMQAFMESFLPAMQRVSDQVKTMPRGSTEDALARVRVAIEGAKAWKATGR